MTLNEEDKKKKKKVNLGAIIARQLAEKELKASFISQGLNPETFTKLKMSQTERDELDKVRILKLKVTHWNYRKDKQPLPKFGTIK